MSCNTDDLTERLLQCLEDLDQHKMNLDTWIDALEELSEIEDAFEADRKNRLHGKTVLDIGTDCVKPLYIALKFEPCKIIGISDDLPDFSSELAQKSKLLTKTRISFYSCNFFNKETLKKILKEEKIKKFDFVLVSKTLHHLRKGECILHEREEHKNHKCKDDEKCCIYKFEEQEIFERLLQLGNKVIIFECFYPHEKDVDKVRGRGGHLTTKEWEQIFSHLSENYRVEFVKPLGCQLDKKELKKVIAKLRQVDCICFYAEAE